MSVTGAPRMVTDGLVLQLDAANIKSYPGSGIVWTDLSQTSVTGSLINGPTFSSLNNGSIVFDGTNDYVQINSPFGDIDWSSRRWSFSAWVRLDALGDRCLVNLNSSNSSHYVVTNVFYTDGKSYWYFIKNSNGSQTNFVQTTSNFTANQTFHFTMTYNGLGLSTGNILFYKNGSKLITTNGGSAQLTNQSGIQIGGNYFLDGNIFIFNMWDRTLSDLEISQNYEATRERFGV